MTLQFILIGPLVAAAIAGFGRDLLGRAGARTVTTATVFVAAALSWYLFVQQIAAPSAGAVTLLDWFSSGTMHVNWQIRFDTLTGVMLVVVTTVSALVHLYSWGYMDEDPQQPKFFAYLSLFTFAMLALVTANNLVQLFFGWEAVGLASYLLIGFWYYKPSANAAAIKAFVVNRVGDFGFALGIFGAYYLFGTIEIDPILAAAPAMKGATLGFLGHRVDALTCVCLLLFLGAMGKSAQLGLHTWLPDAMEGPTPVSALIHAATMVTAGVFMLCRLSPLFEQSSQALTVVTYVGAATCFVAATIGTVQNDIKRVIAYSTMSQLGYMFFAAGVGAYGAAMFHLFTHAFFKALLFLGAGSVIHAMHHEQDMRFYGGLRRAIPVTFWIMMIGTLAITGVGIPDVLGLGSDFGFAGYYSKDSIIESAFARGTHAGQIAFVVGVVVALLTSFYSWRLLFKTFAGTPRWAGSEHIKHAAHHADPADEHGDSPHHPVAAAHGTGGYHPHESPLVMLVPLLALAVGAIGAGFAFHELFVGPERGEAFWHGSLVYRAAFQESAHHVPAWVTWSPFAAWVAGLLIAINSYVWNPQIPAGFKATWAPLHDFLMHKWYFDELYDTLFVKPAFAIGRLFWRGDGRVIDAVGADGLASVVGEGSLAAHRLQTGYVYTYAFVMLFGVAGFAAWMIARG
ncbi:MAG: NADH-quinone oxidoreductase subunit L [Sphingomonadaceae bacterium]|nr:NADH-quinone oxidoreductase subunit L [Sphingomonadaceae bacterium]